jgi:eukaryotic-like serine/threonine-protein kinase
MSLELVSGGLPPASPASPASGHDLSGRRIGAYVLLRRIGEGGMGEVWLAERADGRFEQQVAVKLLHAGLVLPSLAERFRREGAILAKLAHVNIARLIDAGHTIDGQPYLVLEHVQGLRIDAACEVQRLTVQQRLRLFLQVLAAVSHAHARLVIHRDIKPENVLVTSDGAVKLLDFGIAKLTEKDDGTTHLTQLNGQPLTPEFAAPEQLDQGLVTTAADIYALGLLLFMMLTGQHPRASWRGPHWSAHTAIPRASKVVLLPDAPAAWSAQLGCSAAKLSRQLDGDLDNILGKALKHDPSERYATVAAFADDLQHHLSGEPVSARPDSLLYRSSRFVARNKLAVSLAGLALSGILGTAAVAVMAAREARTQRDLALQQQRAALSASLFMAEMAGIQDPQGRPLEAGPWLKQVRQSAQDLFFDEPEVLSLLLPVLVQRNRLAGRDDEANTVLAEFNRLSQQQRDPVAQAWSQCLAALVTHNPERDAALLSELQATLDRLPDGLLGDFVRAQCLSTKAFFLNAVGRHSDALAAHEASRALVAQNQGLLRLTEAEALSARATMLLLSRHLADADTQYLRWQQLLEQRGQARSLDAAAVLAYRGRVAALQGRYVQALQLHEQAATLARGMSGDNEAPAYMDASVMQLRVQMGQCAAAVPLIDSLLLRLKHSLPHWADVRRVEALRQACSGQPEAALLTLDDAQQLAPTKVSIEALALRQLLKCQLLLDTNRSTDALAASEQLLALLPAVDWPRRLEALTLQAHALNALGRWHEAQVVAETMQATLTQQRVHIGDAPNAHDGQALLQQARALAGLGQVDRAKAQVTAALVHLRSALGSAATATATAQKMAAQM